MQWCSVRILLLLFPPPLMSTHGYSEAKTNLKRHTGAKHAYYHENELLLQVAKGVSNPVKNFFDHGLTFKGHSDISIIDVTIHTKVLETWHLLANLDLLMVLHLSTVPVVVGQLDDGAALQGVSIELDLREQLAVKVHFDLGQDFSLRVSPDLVLWDQSLQT